MRFVAISICQKCTTNDDFFCRTLKKQPIFDQKSTFFRDLCPKIFVVRPKKASYLEKFVVHLAFFFQNLSYTSVVQRRFVVQPSKIALKNINFQIKNFIFCFFSPRICTKTCSTRTSFVVQKFKNVQFVVHRFPKCPKICRTLKNFLSYENFFGQF